MFLWYDRVEAGWFLYVSYCVRVPVVLCSVSVSCTVKVSILLGHRREVLGDQCDLCLTIVRLADALLSGASSMAGRAYFSEVFSEAVAAPYTFLTERVEGGGLERLSTLVLD